MVDLFLVVHSHSDGLYGVLEHIEREKVAMKHLEDDMAMEVMEGMEAMAHILLPRSRRTTSTTHDTRSSSSSTPTTRDPRAPTTTSPTKREPTPPLTTLAHHVRPRRRRPRRPRASPPRISDSQFETAVGDGLNVEIIDVEIPGKDYSLSLDEVVGTWRAGQHTAATN